LSLARQFVEMHGGTLTASSEGPGKGSEFTIRLPRRKALPGDPADLAEEPPSPGRGPTRRILVVDDNQDSADTIAVILAKKGHTVQVAYTGEQALDVAASFLPDVIVLDLGLPGMSGYEVAELMRRKASRDVVRLIALTGFGQRADRERSRDAGFD